MFFIESERLKLMPLTHQQLQLLNISRNNLEAALGLQLSNWQVDELYQKEIDDALINFWLPKTLANPDEFIWYTSWEIILKAENLSVGSIGFAGEPNEHGEVEIGYMIDEAQHSKGFASEALQSLSNWALQQERVMGVIVHTFANNLPSINILTKCGYRQFHQTDEGLLSFKLSL